MTGKTELAPIALFVYNRLDHVRRTVDALRNNHLAKESELFIFSDGPRDSQSEEDVARVRGYIKTIKEFKRVTITERDRNFGLSRSITSGVTELISGHGKAIMLEDDLTTSRYFLKFMNEGLLAYENEEKVISICGYMYPLRKKYSDTIFLRVADIWGWATWKRGWDLFSSDGRDLYGRLKSGNALKKFNLDGYFDYAKILRLQAEGKNDSWDVCLYASSFLNGKLSLYPWKSLVINTGFDGSGRHGGVIDYYKTELADEPIAVNRAPVAENEGAAREIGLYLRRQRLNIGYRAFEYLRKTVIQRKRLCHMK